MYFNLLVSLIVVSKVVGFDKHIKRIYKILNCTCGKGVIKN